jgi:hypothetical protein
MIINPAVFWNVATFSQVLTASDIKALNLALMMEAVSISETSVNVYQTTRHNTPAVTSLYILSICNLSVLKEKRHCLFKETVTCISFLMYYGRLSQRYMRVVHKVCL